MPTDNTPDLYVSRPQQVEAIQWDGTTNGTVVAGNWAPGSVRWTPGDDAPWCLELLAGKDGAQDWVPVPVGHWLVRQPGDLSDIWPVDPDYFAAKYLAASPQPDTAPEDDPTRAWRCHGLVPSPDGMLRCVRRMGHDDGHGWDPTSAERWATSPQPDMAPEGPWTAHQHRVLRDDGAEVACYAPHGTDEAADEALAERVAAALNGAPATPAERAVIDAAEAWTTAITAVARRVDDRELRRAAAVAEERIWTTVARLRSERNKNDG